MWGLVKDNKIQEIIKYPRTFIDTENNIKHPRTIFNTWTWEQLNAIGLYEVVDSGGKGDDRFSISDITYTFDAKKKVLKTSYTVQDLQLDDIEAKDKDGKNILDEDGNKVINYGLKTQAIEQTKKTANSLINRFNWLVERSIYDSSKAIPDAVKTYVASIRTDCNDIETAIKGATTIKKFKELYNNELNEDGTIKTQNRMGRWTNDKTVKEYLR